MTKKISLMIIGAQKAGTTSLKNYLGEHPNLVTHVQTDFGYFISDTEWQLKYEDALVKYFDKSAFPDHQQVVVKNAGQYNSEEAMQRLKTHNPDCKLVFVIRNPIERALSSYNMEHSRGWMQEPFDEIIQQIVEGKIKRTHSKARIFFDMGVYADALELIYQYFPKEQVHVVLYDEFKDNPETTVKQIFDFMAIDSSFVPDFSKQYNTTKSVRSDTLARFIFYLRRSNNFAKTFLKSVLPAKTFFKLTSFVMSLNHAEQKPPSNMKPATRKILVDYFTPHNKRLQEMIGLNVEHWNK